MVQWRQTVRERHTTRTALAHLRRTTLARAWRAWRVYWYEEYCEWRHSVRARFFASRRILGMCLTAWRKVWT